MDLEQMKYFEILMPIDCQIPQDELLIVLRPFIFSPLVSYDSRISHSAFQKKMSLLSSQHAAISVKEKRVREADEKESEGGEMSLINSSEAVFIF